VCPAAITGEFLLTRQTPRRERLRARARSRSLFRMKLSVVIPYRGRLPYLQRMLRALVDQDLAADRYEIVIGCLEYCPEVTRYIADLPRRVSIRCVMSDEPWQVGVARNHAFRSAEGDLLVLVDVDMLLPRPALRLIAERFERDSTPRAVIGQMLGYVYTRDTGTVDLEPYEFFRDRFLATADRSGFEPDERWTLARRVPWSLCWTALMAIPRAAVVEHDLYFDRVFRGWGAEDLEWGYRIAVAGLRIEFADDWWAIHMPHPRDTARNEAAIDRNYDAFIAKWPHFDVELIATFGEPAVDRRFDEFEAERASVAGAGANTAVVELMADGRRHLAIGVVHDSAGRLLNATDIPGFPDCEIRNVLPLLGLRLPFAPGSIDTAYLLPPIGRAAPELRALIQRAAGRVARRTMELAR